MHIYCCTLDLMRNTFSVGIRRRKLFEMLAILRQQSGFYCFKVKGKNNNIFTGTLPEVMKFDDFTKKELPYRSSINGAQLLNSFLRNRKNFFNAFRLHMKNVYVKEEEKAIFLF